MGRKHNLIILSSVLLFIFMFNGNFNLFLQEFEISFKKQNIKDFNIKFPSTSNSVISEWYKTWGGSSTDKAYGVAVDSSYNIYVVGETYSFGAGGADIVLIKYNSLGEQIWYKTWGGSSTDKAYGVAVDSTDNIYVVGETNSFGAGGADIVLVKYNSSGVQQCNKTWGGSSNDKAYGVTVDSSTNIYIVGETQSDVVLLKYNSTFDYQWNRTWGGSDFDIGRGIALDSSDNILIAGYTRINNPEFYDIVLVKYNSTGIQLWNKTWGRSDRDDHGYGVALDSSENIFVVGKKTPLGGFRDIILVKFNSVGVELWNKTWGYSWQHEEGYGVIVDSSENIFIVGDTYNQNLGYQDILLAKYNNSGEHVWDKIWNGSIDDRAFGVNNDFSGNIYVVGCTESFGAGGYDIVLLKYIIDSDGDGLSDWQEENIYFTDPNDSDSDDDGLTDGAEINTYSTDPNNPDTDGDGFNDGEEVSSGFDPNNTMSNPLMAFILITALIIISIGGGGGVGFYVYKKKYIPSKIEKDKFKKERLESLKSKIREDLDAIPLLLKSNKLGDAFNKLIKCQKIANEENFSSLIEEIDNQLSQVKSLIREENLKKTKKTILDLGTKFTRLQIVDISEKSGIQDEGLISEVILDMIKNKEIYAEYFKESKSVAFNQQANIDEIDKLMEAYKDWEEKKIKKK